MWCITGNTTWRRKTYAATVLSWFETVVVKGNWGVTEEILCRLCKTVLWVECVLVACYIMPISELAEDEKGFVWLNLKQTKPPLRPVVPINACILDIIKQYGQCEQNNNGKQAHSNTVCSWLQRLLSTAGHYWCAPFPSALCYYSLLPITLSLK